jgi:hypothetical protein
VTDVALKEYLESLIKKLEEKLAAQREGDQRALTLATRAMEHRLAAMNMFRRQILEERGLYVRIDTFKWTMGFLVALLGLVVVLVRVWR